MIIFIDMPRIIRNNKNRRGREPEAIKIINKKERLRAKQLEGDKLHTQRYASGWHAYIN